MPLCTSGEVHFDRCSCWTLKGTFSRRDAEHIEDEVTIRSYFQAIPLEDAVVAWYPFLEYACRMDIFAEAVQAW